MRTRIFEDIEKRAIAPLLAAMALCMLAAACCRHLLPGAAPYPMRAAAGCLTWLASLGMARAAALGVHTRVSFIEEAVAPRTRLRLNAVADAAFLVFSGCSFLAGCFVLAASIRTPFESGHPLVYAAIPIGSLLTIVRLLQRLRRRKEEQREGAAP